MRKIKLLIGMTICTTIGQAQITTPKASPLCKIEQKVGLADISISYSRPGVKARNAFGDVVEFGEIWRLGANENTKITSSENLIFGKDTLKAGTYALYAIPEKKSWQLIFYTETTNWGVPDNWSEDKIAYKTTLPVYELKDRVENLSIFIDKISNNGAEIQIAWDQTKVALPFSLTTKDKVVAGILKTMSGPKASDYHQAANYYFTEKIDMKQALIWSTLAVEMQGEKAYWMTRLKAQLQAENGDFKGAIETANKSMEAAALDNDSNYVKMNKASIEEWSKK